MAPTGYSITVSCNKVMLGETFDVYVTPNSHDFDRIVIYGVSPSGVVYTKELGDVLFDFIGREL